MYLVFEHLVDWESQVLAERGAAVADKQGPVKEDQKSKILLMWHCTVGPMKNGVKSGQLLQIISPWMLIIEFQNFEQSCRNSPKMMKIFWGEYGQKRGKVQKKLLTSREKMHCSSRGHLTLEASWQSASSPARLFPFEAGASMFAAASAAESASDTLATPSLLSRRALKFLHQLQQESQHQQRNQRQHQIYWQPPPFSVDEPWKLFLFYYPGSSSYLKSSYHFHFIIISCSSYHDDKPNKMTCSSSSSSSSSPPPSSAAA